MDHANELSEMQYDEVSLVFAGANHEAHVMLSKAQPTGLDVLRSGSARYNGSRRASTSSFKTNRGVKGSKKKTNTSQTKTPGAKTPGSLSHTARGAKAQLSRAGRLRPDNRFSKSTLNAIEKARKR